MAFAIYLVMIFNIKDITPVQTGRLYSGFFLLAALFSLILIVNFPYRRLARPLLLFILSLPGIAVYIATIATNLVFTGAEYNGFVSLQGGRLLLIYPGVFFLYLIVGLIVLFSRSRVKANRAISKEIVLVFTGLASSIILMLALLLIAINFGYLRYYFNMGVPFLSVLLLVLVNHSVSDLKSIDYKTYYLDLFYKGILFSIMLIPVFLLLKYRKDILPETKSSFIGLSFIIFFFLFLFFRLIKPLIGKLFQKEYRELTKNFDQFFKSIPQLSVSDESTTYWNSFYEGYIRNLHKNFKIKNAHFYTHNIKKNAYTYTYGYGTEPNDDVIPTSSAIVKCLISYTDILEKPRLLFDESLTEHRDQALEFMISNSVELAIPFLDNTRKLKGILFLGFPEGKKTYTKAFISALELYRIQFQRQFSIRLIMEEMKSTQVIEHDKMVNTAIKKKIIPQKLDQIEGLRISSFNINNSMLGGDYFDTVMLDQDNLVIFIADSGYTGVDSALVSLELYTVLHTRSKTYISTNNILNAMSWVVSTSVYFNKYAPAFCIIYSPEGELTYSNAAFNPLVLFDSAKNQFRELTTEGLPIGVDREYVYESKTIKPLPENIGLLYSDGLISAINNSGENYSIERPKEIIRKNSHETPATLTRLIFQDFKNHIQNRDQVNDVSVIVFKT